LDGGVRVSFRLRPGLTREALSKRYPRARFFSQSGPIVTGRLPASVLSAVESDAGIVYADAASRLDPALDVARSTASASGLALGVVDPASPDFGANLGSGAIVGIVDSGIDFRHPDFSRGADPSRTRILAIWDQTDPAGPSPASPFGYGTLWSRAQIEAELGASPPGLVRSADTLGHGTHVAGIAAGGGQAPGLAPEAELLVVKTTFWDTDILDGVRFIADSAGALGRPAVINLSLSSQSGPHDGSGNFEVGVAAVGASLPVVAAAGNFQETDGHASALVAPGGSADFHVRRISGAAELYLEFWTPGGDRYELSVATDASRATEISAGFASFNSASLGPTLVEIDNARNAHPSGDRQIALTISASPRIVPSEFYLRLRRTASGSTGRVDGYIESGSAAKFADHVDYSGTVGSPASAAGVIAVGSFCSKRAWTARDGSVQTDPRCPPSDLGGLSPISGRGPTRDGRIKPDLAAPGHRVASALSADMDPPPDPGFITPDGRHRLLWGTSMAAPVVAGIAALKLSAALSAARIKESLGSSAVSDPAVSSFGPAPNNGWGYGKVRVKACGEPLEAAAEFGVPAAMGVSSISWTWSRVAGASSYEVAPASAPDSRLACVAGTSFSWEGLLPNTTYAISVRGVGPCGPGPASASPAAATLSAAPGVPAEPFVAVTSSITVRWIPLPPSPSSAACLGYLVEAAAEAGSPGGLVSGQVLDGSASELGLSGLDFGTTYYVRVGSLNQDLVPNFSLLGSTCILTQVLSSGSVANASDFSLSLVPPFREFSSIRADIPMGSLPAGVRVVLNASAGAFMPPPASNQAALRPVGRAGFHLSAQGAQPAIPVVLTMAYDPGRLPAGADPKTLALARYSEPDGQWSLLPSAVDTGAGTVRAAARHFSFFAPFFVSAGSGLASVQVFPVPWMPRGGDAEFEASGVTFSSLPPGGGVKIFSLQGELVWEGSASPAGLVLWDGLGRGGSRAGSGTYLAVITGGGGTAVRRVVVVR
jgi:hypothetical protein